MSFFDNIIQDKYTVHSVFLEAKSYIIYYSVLPQTVFLPGVLPNIKLITARSVLSLGLTTAQFTILLCDIPMSEVRGRASPNEPKHRRFESLVPWDLWFVVFPGLGWSQSCLRGACIIHYVPKYGLISIENIVLDYCKGELSPNSDVNQV